MSIRIPLTDFSTVSLPAAENELSSRLLSLITRWVPVALQYHQPWPGRPNCGHFFGGSFAYGLDVSMAITPLALAASSPDYAPTPDQPSADQLKRLVHQGIRFLCFTHDVGPVDCIRPGDTPDSAGTKWGERGKGFFPESQCGRTLSEMAFSCALIHDLLGEEERDLLAAIALDYLDRFGMMPPRSGVYNNTQTEENGWTALGLVSCLLLLPEHPRSDELWESARRWMFCTNTRPEDAADNTVFADGKTVRELCGNTFTAHPDGTAENHGFVHPNYMASGITLPGKALNLLRLFGQPVPPHLLWRVRDTYDVLKPWCDDAGAAQAVQGMDWPYYAYPGAAFLHSIGNLHLGDPDAALLEERALDTLEQSQAAHGGRLVTREVIDNASFGARSSLLGERMSDCLAQAGLAHRLDGKGQVPSDPSEMQTRLSGVTLYPQGGVLVHRHARGVTSFSWRNRTMLLPAPREGLKFLCAADRSVLSHPQVKGRSNRLEQIALKIRDNADSVSAVLIQDLCEGSVRRTVCFASLPDGKTLAAEWLTALEAVTVDHLDQGTFGIVNDGYFGEHGDLKGRRTVHHASGQVTFEGYVTGREEDNETVELTGARWINIDDRYGIVYRGSGSARYENRRAFSPWRAVENTLALHPADGPRTFEPRDQIGRFVTLCCPGQSHPETAQQALEVRTATEAAFVAETESWSCAFATSDRGLSLMDTKLGPYESRIKPTGK